MKIELNELKKEWLGIKHRTEKNSKDIASAVILLNSLILKLSRAILTVYYNNSVLTSIVEVIMIPYIIDETEIT